jgi:outer membrane protein assembly factor BamB
MKNYLSLLHKLLSIIVIFCSFSCSCNIIGSENTPQPQWSVSLSTGKLINGLLQNVYGNNTLIALGDKNGQSILYGIDISSGKIKFEWSDLFSSREIVFSYNTYLFQKTWLLHNSPNLYAIDIETGKTRWKTTYPMSRDRGITGFSEHYYMSNYNKAFEGNVSTGLEREIFSIEEKSVLGLPTTYISGQDTSLVFAVSYAIEDSLRNYFYRAHLLLFNLSKKQIVYNIMQREGYANAQTGFLTPNGLPVIYKSSVFIAIGKSLQCNDILTGKLLWQNKDFEGDFSLSGLTSANDKLYGCATDDNLYCIDIATGKIVWKTPTGGSSTGLLHLNGIIYLASIGDGKLYAIDANTGAYIWQLRSPDYESSNKQSFFKDNVTTDGKNIFVSTYLNLYCYKAAR